MINNDKRLGMLIGLHVGDCLGIPLEFKSPSKEGEWLTEIIGGGAFNFPAGVGSDDTDLMLCLLRSLAKNKKFVIEDMAMNLVKWKHTNPPDIGTTTRYGIANIEKGELLEDCGLFEEHNQGNGSIMRCAPIALVPDITDDEIASQARLTHGHPMCVRTDTCFVTLLRYVLGGNDPEKFDIIHFFNDDDAQRYLKTCTSLKWDEVPNSGWCVDSLGIALWALHNYDNFEDAILAVINRGDDADTGGAVAGALLGAYYGYEAIPKRWVDELESADEIKSLLAELDK